MANSTLPQINVLARPQARNGVAQLIRRLLGSLRGRIGVLTVAIALGTAVLLTAWAWFGTAAVLPLLYTLPCAAMMLLCMRGHGGSKETPTNRIDSNGS